MMEAKELRIGNLFNTNITNETWTVTGLLTNGVYYVPRIFTNTILTDKNFFSLNCYLEPIPLTEGWFTKFGFIGSGHYRLNNIEVGTVNDDFVHGQFTIKFTGYYIKKIKFVHEFQNLVFALTGEELTLAE